MQSEINEMLSMVPAEEILSFSYNFFLNDSIMHRNVHTLIFHTLSPFSPLIPAGPMVPL